MNDSTEFRREKKKSRESVSFYNIYTFEHLPGTVIFHTLSPYSQPNIMAKISVRFFHYFPVIFLKIRFTRILLRVGLFFNTKLIYVKKMCHYTHFRFHKITRKTFFSRVFNRNFWIYDAYFYWKVCKVF